MAHKEVDIVNNNHSYFHSLELEGINCFKDKQKLELSDSSGNYSQWTIILGDNGTGKTTLLRVLDRMQPVNVNKKNEEEQESGSVSSLFNTFFRSKEFNVSLFSIEKRNLEEFTVSSTNNLDFAVLSVSRSVINVFILSYGASRRMSKSTSLSKLDKNKITSLFDESIELINAEEWYLQKFLAFSTSENGIKIKLEQQLSLMKKVLVDFLPDVLDLRIKEIKTVNDKSALEVKINDKEWINLRDLSFGYQTLTALIVDIASKMMEQYPNSYSPLEEPVIVLIDEIDLHLHPKWQRTVIDKLSQNFPKAQFIATSHSPLIVQAAQDKGANIVVCRKEGDKVIIDNDPDEVKGWRIDQILISDLFDVDSSRSKLTQDKVDEYISLKGKEKLSESDKKKMKILAPLVEKAYNQNIFNSDLDKKLHDFAEKFLK
jgi:predicted ATP-binding protein involved in virulence